MKNLPKLLHKTKAKVGDIEPSMGCT